ncbi:CrcB family protein [Helicobacter sp. 11S02629-2]|uniref:fluoride efflux transporter FluC n=1 Tax=Helicobacter sp. 11S02629-2 TaxID=1476195 RepID=UPI000BA737B0|nr:CrcB family protein [Helicobacter sp. 11S02629-2]PAF44078.1 hypothetical protein BKH40_06310 [Helicobacter sp. 11S02629-2]
MSILVVFIGGGVGSVLRFLISKGVAKLFTSLFIFESSTNLAYASAAATFFVNIFGSLLIGFLSAIFLYKFSASEHLRLFLMVGLCGGFTTFSAFSLDTLNLLKLNQTLALAYLFATLFISIGLCLVGILLGKNIALSC